VNIQIAHRLLDASTKQVDVGVVRGKFDGSLQIRKRPVMVPAPPVLKPSIVVEHHALAWLPRHAAKCLRVVCDGFAMIAFPGPGSGPMRVRRVVRRTSAWGSFNAFKNRSLVSRSSLF